VKVIPARPLKPILKNLRLESDGKAIFVSATDLEVSICVEVDPDPAGDLKPFQICLPGGLLKGILSECEHETVSLEIPEGSVQATLKAGKDQYQLHGMATDDFPELENWPEDLSKYHHATLPAADLARLFLRTYDSIAREQGRYAINGLNLRIEEKKLIAVSTDGRRLSFDSAACEYQEGEAGEGLLATASNHGAILPIGAIKTVNDLCCEAPEGTKATLLLDGRAVLFQIGKSIVKALQIEGIFPKYRSVIPNHPLCATFKRQDLVQALRRAQYMTSSDTASVRFEIKKALTGAECKLQSTSPDKGTSEVVLDIESEVDVGIQFNPSFLLEALKVLECEQVRLYLNNGAHPGRLQPVEDGDGYIYVIMPVSPKE
jgi:DNA polymerase-3 subunit beta